MSGEVVQGDAPSRLGDASREVGGPASRGPRTRSRRMVVVNGILPFVMIIDVLQLWLLTATMNAYLGGDTSIVVPAAFVSTGCLLLNLGLLRYLYRLGG